MTEQGLESVLIIDDNPDNCQLYRRIIEAGLPEANILIAHNGTEGIRLTHLYKPDIILCDLNMPDLSGFNVCKAIFSNDETINIPIVMITAFGDSSTRARAFEVGVSEYMTKPFDFEEFIEIMKKILRGKRLGLYDE